MKVIQISDTHLFSDDERDIFGVKSNFKFKEVMDKVIDEESNDTDMIFLNAKNFNRNTRLSLPDWHLIFLNTKLEGRDDGQLSQSELALLSDELAASPPDKKIAIVMHHHPAPVGTPLIDHYILKNTKAFWDIVTETKVELIICGHVHGDYRFKHNNIMIESSPATCLQWEKGAKELKIDLKIGYKIYHFDKDGYRATAKMW